MLNRAYCTRKGAWKWVKFEARKLRLFEARFPVFDVLLYIHPLLSFPSHSKYNNGRERGQLQQEGFETVSPRFCPLKIARAKRNSFPLKNARFPTGKGNKKKQKQKTPPFPPYAIITLPQRSPPPPPLLARSRLTKFSPLNMGREGRSVGTVPFLSLHSFATVPLSVVFAIWRFAQQRENGILGAGFAKAFPYNPA